MLAIMFSVLLVAAPVPKDAKAAPPPGKLDGVWKCTEREMRGRTTAMKEGGVPSNSYTLVITGGEYAFRTHAGTITIDADKKTFDMKVTEGRYKDLPSEGIFERTGDTLKIALPSIPRVGSVRPTELKTEARSTNYVYTFELDKMATAEQVAAKLKDLKTAVAASPIAQPAIANPFQPAAPPRVQAADAKTQETLEKILEKLEKIEKRLEELEKKK